MRLNLLCLRPAELIFVRRPLQHSFIAQSRTIVLTLLLGKPLSNNSSPPETVFLIPATSAKSGYAHICINILPNLILRRKPKSCEEDRWALLTNTECGRSTHCPGRILFTDTIGRNAVENVSVLSQSGHHQFDDYFSS